MNAFVFQWPAALLLLLLALPLAGLLMRAQGQRRQVIKALGGNYTTHRRLRENLRMLAFILLILALARPGHSPQIESVSRSGRDVVFALDVSQSMLAEDIAPSRLEVAKQGIRDALQSMSQQRVGLIAYAGSASILCPLTYDYDFVRYMLEQAHPRTVDFGGTAVQAAVEKAADQVFMEDREGVQDLIILTDGGDHGSVISKVVALLEQRQIDALVVGLGHPTNPTTIPVVNEEGETTLLKSQGQTVYTQLDDSALKAFAALSQNIDYHPIGIEPFDLGKLYLDYAKDKQNDQPNSESGLLVYKEAALYFLIPGLLLLVVAECWGTRGFQLGQAAAAIVCVFSLSMHNAEATDVALKQTFTNTLSLIKKGNFEEAESQLAELYQTQKAGTASRAELAVIQFNRGLCFTQLAQDAQAKEPGDALYFAENAQLAYLSAKRYAPDIQRIGIRIELTAQLVFTIQQQIEDEQQANAALQEIIDILIEQLQAMLKAQQALRADLSSKDKQSHTPETLSKRQIELLQNTAPIQDQMQAIEANMHFSDDEQPTNTKPVFSIMTQPLTLLKEAKTAQEQAAELLAQRPKWSSAKAPLIIVENRIEGILEILANDNKSQSQDMEAYDEMEDYYDDYMDENEESIGTSDDMRGDLAASAELQALPVPNYSVEDILLEEQGSLQFRQQKRADANAKKVEKDF